MWFDTSSGIGSPTPWSFLSCEPAVWVTGHGDELVLRAGPTGDRGWLRRLSRADPGTGLAYDRLAAIGRALRRAPSPSGSPRFGGGFAGCFSYDLGRRFERIPSHLPTELPWDFQLGFYDEVLAVQPDRKVLHNQLAGGRRLPDLLVRGPNPGFAPYLTAGADSLPRAEVDEPTHRAGVERIRDLIRAGAVYQANLTFRFRAPAPDPRAPLGTFLRLRMNNPSPYGAYLDLPDVSLVSASPESFLDLQPDGLVTSRPIKGTTARFDDPIDDAASRQALLDSAKDRAELAMIVDLVRNDLGRVCTPGTVDRNPRLRLEGHPAVWHLVGDVQGRLRPERDAFDLLRASFPPGSCIGAPKIRAMAELESIEASRRGPYTGAIGWIGVDGSASFSVAIRTIAFRGGVASYGVGGGIVYDSVAESEWREALLKGEALGRALAVPAALRAEQTLDLSPFPAKISQLAMQVS